MSTHSRTFLVFFIATGFLLIGSWSLTAQSSNASSANTRRTSLTGEFEGVIQAARVIGLSAPADGLLDTVFVERGDFVKKGQVVATLESTVETATWELAKARAGMESEQRSRYARLEFLNAKLAREEELHSQGILSDEELDLRRTERRVAEEALSEANDRRSLAMLEQKRAAAALALRTVHSPIDGVVIDRMLSGGELVTRQHQSKILRLAQIDPLVIEVIVPGEVFGQIAEGATAEVYPVGFSQYQATATVKTVDRVIDAASHTFRISLEMPNPDYRLPAGVRCTVSFPPGQ